MVTKSKADPAQQQTGDTSALRHQYDLTLVGEGEFDGQKMWMLEGTPKAKADEKAPPAGPSKVKVDIGQKDLMAHRITVLYKGGSEVVDVQLTNLKVNPTLDPALFKYTPPAGAEVTDMTKGLPPMPPPDVGAGK
jgi:outer membrane lipoprotein-sorting protein